MVIVAPSSEAFAKDGGEAVISGEDVAGVIVVPSGDRPSGRGPLPLCLSW